MRLDISVHNTFAVAEIQCLEISSVQSVLGDRPSTNLQELEDVISYVIIHELGVKTPEVRVVDIFEYQRGRLALAIPHNVQQCDHIGPSTEILQDLDLPLNLLLLDRLQHLDDAFLVVHDVDPFEHL